MKRVNLQHRKALVNAKRFCSTLGNLPTIPPNYSFNIPDSVHPYIDAVDSIHKDTWRKRVETTNCRETDYNRATVKHYIECFWTYNSNALDGSTLSLEETMQHVALGEGLSTPARDRINGALNHDEAVKFLNQEVARGAPLSPSLIRELHFDLWRDTQSVHGGIYRTERKLESLDSGETRAYTDPRDIPSQVQDLCDWVNAHTSSSSSSSTTTQSADHLTNTPSVDTDTFNDPTTHSTVTTNNPAHSDTTTTSNPNIALHPIVVATIAHYNFLRIQPFQSGNGRCSRLLLNFILTKHAYLPAVVRYRRKDEYLRALESANSGDIVPLVVFVTEEMNYSDYIYQFFTTDRIKC